MIQLVRRDYIWPSLRMFVNKYVDGCELCQRTKPIRAKPVGLLQPLSTPEGPWQMITYNFIPGLPKSEGHDVILMVVDSNTKMAHFIPMDGLPNASKLADVMIKEVFRLHGLLLKTVSDQGPQFNSQFLRAIYKKLNISPSFSTAYHPQTDGQSERANQEVEQFIRLFTSHGMDDWSHLLPLTEFMFNNGRNASTGMSPFYANYGYYPTFTTCVSLTNNPEAESHIAHIHEVQKEIHSAMDIAKALQKHYYDQGIHKQYPYQEGDKVWLSAENIKTNRPSHKLSHC